MVVFVALVVYGQVAAAGRGRGWGGVGVDRLRLVVRRPYLVVLVVEVLRPPLFSRLSVSAPIATLVQQQRNDNPDDNDDRYSDAEAYDEQQLLHGDSGHRRAAGVRLLTSGDAGSVVRSLVFADRRRRLHRRRRRRRPVNDTTGRLDDGVRHRPIAVLAVVSSRACALVAVDAVDARAAVQTRRTGAFVRVDPAVLAREARRAVAREVVDEIVTRRPVGARPSGAVVDVRLTERPDEARHAATHEVVDAVVAGGAVEARLQRAVVGVVVARGPRVAGPTDAAEPVELVDAAAA